jgi:hypothetical protein
MQQKYTLEVTFLFDADKGTKTTENLWISFSLQYLYFKFHFLTHMYRTSQQMAVKWLHQIQLKGPVSCNADWLIYERLLLWTQKSFCLWLQTLRALHSDALLVYIVHVHVDGVRLCLRTAASNRPVHPPDDKWVWRAKVEWYCDILGFPW